MFSERLAILLEERNMRQVDLAKYLNLSRTTVSLYLSGARTPDTQTLQRISELTGYSIDWLLGKTEARGNEPRPWEMDKDLYALMRAAAGLPPEAREEAARYITYLHNEVDRKEREKHKS